MHRQRDFVEGFRITRTDETLIIEATDYHARPLRLTQAELSELGIRLDRAAPAKTGKKKPKKKPSDGAEV